MTDRILVVEDDPDVSHLVATRLTRGGYAVRTAASGSEAVTLCSGDRVPDLLVLDVGLPDTTGFELLTRLRALPGMAETPTIFLSARVQEHDLARGRALGAEYLTKPFVASALLDRVAACLGRREPAW